MSPGLVHLEEVQLGYERPLFPALNFKLQAGEYLGVVGPNGGGKTTLARTLCGTLRPLSGRVRYSPGRPRIGYVPQKRELNELFPLTALEVVALSLVATLPWYRGLGAEHWERSRQLLYQLGVGALAQVPFRTLSGGQAQRVLLARALANDPDLLILDEPTSALDPASEEALLSKVASLHRTGVTVVLVSHQLGLTATHAERLVLVDHERSIFRAEPTEQLLDPKVLEEVYGAKAKVGRCHGQVVIAFEPRSEPWQELAPEISRGA